MLGFIGGLVFVYLCFLAYKGHLGSVFGKNLLALYRADREDDWYPVAYREAVKADAWVRKLFPGKDLSFPMRALLVSKAVLANSTHIVLVGRVLDAIENLDDSRYRGQLKPHEVAIFDQLMKSFRGGGRNLSSAFFDQ